MSGVKLCKDCVHAIGGGGSMRCGHLKVPPQYLATGERAYASTTRMWMGRCGEAGKLFEAKVSRKAQPSATEYPELEPLPGLRVSWWGRLQARLHRWVNS